MISLERLRNSRAARNAAASYFAFFSTAACGLVSIPVAVSFLSKSQIGLWTVVNSVVSYLMWMDLGIGSATGRKMADAVAAKDQQEINKWWTATRAALVVQGLLMALIGLACVPLLLGFFEIEEGFRPDAVFLLAGSIILTSVMMPMRGVPGLMTAQERFHWIPLGQGVTPWLQLGAFFLMLRGGWGVRSYIASMAATQFATWAYYLILVRSGDLRPGWNRQGLEMERFRSLFGFSLNISLMAMIEAVLTSLPNLILARFGGLASVPLYTFTQRGSSLVTSLVRRTYHAFYPQILRLHVSDRREEFKYKHRQVGHLMMGLALFAAGTVLGFNRTIVNLLAGPDFYAGDLCTTWFALAVIITPLCGLFESLLQFSGSMGKSAVVGLLKLACGAAAAFAGYRFFGIAGVAAVFALLPLIYGSYGFYRGAKGCGYDPGELSSSVVIHGALASMLVVGAGWGMSALAESGWHVPLGGRNIHIPGIGHLLLSGLVCFAGALSGLRALHSLKSQVIPSGRDHAPVACE